MGHSSSMPLSSHAMCRVCMRTALLPHPTVADQVRATITGRQQRQRKQSRWLQETFDPNAGELWVAVGAQLRG